MAESGSNLDATGLPAPALQEVGIVGFAHERWGEAPHALVILKQGERAGECELPKTATGNSTFSPPADLYRPLD